MAPHWVTTVIRCTRHRRECPAFCLRVDRGVPDELRCSPGGGSVGGGGGGAFFDCPCGGRFDVDDVRRRVTEELRRNMQRWRQRGAVVIDY